ncbi:MAG: hypothetical protein M3297_01420 [Thermoproteota archaeon]|nr:hypothetical protein [Thermoproteota archaeon]
MGKLAYMLLAIYVMTIILNREGEEEPTFPQRVKRIGHESSRSSQKIVDQAYFEIGYIKGLLSL